MGIEIDDRRDRLYEGGGGQLWMVPAGESVAIRMPEDGDWLTDCRMRGDSWDLDDVHVDDRAPLDTLDHPEVELIATYDPRDDQATIEEHSWGDLVAGAAGRSYLGVDHPASETYRGEDG